MLLLRASFVAQSAGPPVLVHLDFMEGRDSLAPVALREEVSNALIKKVDDPLMP